MITISADVWQCVACRFSGSQSERIASAKATASSSSAAGGAEAKKGGGGAAPKKAAKVKAEGAANGPATSGRPGENDFNMFSVAWWCESFLTRVTTAP